MNFPFYWSKYIDERIVLYGLYYTFRDMRWESVVMA